MFYKELAQKIFYLPDTSNFMIVDTDNDPRGFIEVYGENIEDVHVLPGSYGDLNYRFLSCFWDYLSVEFVGYFTLSITAEDSGEYRIDFISDYPIPSRTVKDLKTLDIYEIVFSVEEKRREAK